MLLATISFVPKVVATIAVCSQCDSISEYSDLVSVIMGGSCGNSIGFGGDIRCTGNVGTLSRDLIIDGNQHSLTGNDAAAGIIVENANLTVKNIVNFENFKSASKGGHL